MHVMQTGDLSVLEQVERIEDIKETFRRRAHRREFPTIKYLVYLQFSAVVAQEEELVDGLIRYGFDHLYHKLRPLDRVTALEIAAGTQPSYLPKLLDKFACEFLLADYGDLLEQYSSDLILQAMSIYHKVKYQRVELWQKMEEMLEGLITVEEENREE